VFSSQQPTKLKTRAEFSPLDVGWIMGGTLDLGYDTKYDMLYTRANQNIIECRYEPKGKLCRLQIAYLNNGDLSANGVYCKKDFHTRC